MRYLAKPGATANQVKVDAGEVEIGTQPFRNPGQVTRLGRQHVAWIGRKLFRNGQGLEVHIKEVGTMIPKAPGMNLEKPRLSAKNKKGSCWDPG
jgi:hypothetical protein